jgi:hypothetical protein
MLGERPRAGRMTDATVAFYGEQSSVESIRIAWRNARGLKMPSRSTGRVE